MSQFNLFIQREGNSARVRARWLLLIPVVMLTACVLPPEESVRYASEPPPPPPVKVVFYPTRGQSVQQQDRDRYECYLWASQKTGFDPSAPQLAPHQRMLVVPEQPPSAEGSAAGALAGAVIGSIIAPHGRAAEGAFAGAVTGAIIGSAADAERNEQIARTQQNYDQKRFSQVEQTAYDYRRALAACLEGRGYSVKFDESTK